MKAVWILVDRLITSLVLWRYIMPMYKFYERTDEGTKLVGSISILPNKVIWNIPNWLQKDISARIMPDGTQFDRFNLSHVALIPAEYRYSRLFVIVDNNGQQEIVR